MSRLHFGTAAILLLLLCAPLQLSAQEREAPAARQVSVLEWFSGLWTDFAAWLAGKAPSPPDDSALVDGSCAIDPFGCPHGG